MQIISTAFDDNALIPPQYTCDGKGYNPPITFHEIPEETVSLILFMEDPDAPGNVFTHWLLYNMPKEIVQIEENQTPSHTKEGMNSIGTIGYVAPCPPSNTHRYIFTLFALNTFLDLPNGSSKEQIEESMKNHIITTAKLTGIYSKNK
jgi:Raf kinase inhibitor-like YbhB/YbcL family protein